MPFLNLATPVNLAAPQNATQFSASRIIIDLDPSTGAISSADVIYAGGTLTTVPANDGTDGQPVTTASAVFNPVSNNMDAHVDAAGMAALMAANPTVEAAVAQMIYGAIQAHQGVVGTIA